MRNLKEIIFYVHSNIIPQYLNNDQAHGFNHIKYVCRRILTFAKKYKCDLAIAYTAAAYHDIGHHVDPKNHHIVSAEIFMNDKKISKWFNINERIIIKEAIEDHRASGDEVPRSIYGELLSSADRTIDPDLAIQRSVAYNVSHLGNKDFNLIFENVTKYLSKKYGEYGYAKTFINENKYYKAVKKIRSYLKKPKRLERKIALILKAM